MSHVGIDTKQKQKIWHLTLARQKHRAHSILHQLRGTGQVFSGKLRRTSRRVSYYCQTNYKYQMKYLSNFVFCFFFFVFLTYPHKGRGRGDSNL
jgi:hypothetical protein